jgi:hypothetical protein
MTAITRVKSPERLSILIARDRGPRIFHKLNETIFLEIMAHNEMAARIREPRDSNAVEISLGIFLDLSRISGITIDTNNKVITIFIPIYADPVSNINGYP